MEASLTQQKMFLNEAIVDRETETLPPPVTQPSRCEGFRLPHWTRFPSFSSSDKADTKDLAPAEEIKTGTLENYPKGYGRFAALMAGHPSFHIFRRFTWLRMRMILREQDELTILEKKLKKIDKREKNVMHLKSHQLFKGGNKRRLALLKETAELMGRYDKHLLNTKKILSVRKPNKKDVQSLRNWLEGNACVVLEETKFLEEDDLCAIVGPSDEGQEIFHRIAESLLIKFNKLFRKNKQESDFTRDKHVHVFDDSKFSGCVSGAVISLSVALLLVPIIILSVINPTWLRMLVVFLSVVAFVTTMSLCTRARVSELLAGSAAYAAVLVVFLSGTS